MIKYYFNCAIYINIYCQWGPYYGGLEYFNILLSTDKINREQDKKIEVINSRENTPAFYREIETSAFIEFEKTSARFYAAAKPYSKS